MKFRQITDFIRIVSWVSTNLCEQAQRSDVERFLDMHMYITTALQRDDMRAVTLNLALDLLYQKACKHDNLKLFSKVLVLRKASIFLTESGKGIWLMSLALGNLKN